MIELVANLRADNARLREAVKLLREALVDATAAMWDAHYGEGISTRYAQTVDAVAKRALAATADLDKEPTP